MPDPRASSRRRGNAAVRSSRAVWLERSWQFIARPRVAGVVLWVAGVIVMLTPTATVPAQPSHAWWVAAYRFTNAVQSGMTLLVAAAAAGVAILATQMAGRRRHPLSTLAVALMWLGVTLGVATWFYGQADVPTSRVAIAPGQTIQSYPAVESGHRFQVMLPTRVFVVEVDPEAERATIELRQPGAESGVRNDVFVGDPLDIGGVRVALIGMEVDPRSNSAVVTMEGGIERVVVPNSTVRFVPDGPEYQVKSIARNYLGSMGPAVEIVTPDGDAYWATQRDSALTRPFTDVRLLRIQSSPVPVFAVTKTPAGGFVPVAAVVFALGMALFLFGRSRPVVAKAASDEASR